MALRYDINTFISNIPDHSCFVNAYEVDREYGGPEEGGWWYNTLTPLASIYIRDKGQAMKAFDFIESLYRDKYENTPDISSVASTGSLNIWCENHIAEYEPKERPHYE